MAGSYTIDFPELAEMDRDMLDHWARVRKEKKCPLTAFALKTLQGVCDYHGITLEQGIEICATNNWVSIRKHWDIKEYLPKKPKQEQQRQTQVISDEERQRRIENGLKGATQIRQALRMVK